MSRPCCIALASALVATSAAAGSNRIWINPVAGPFDARQQWLGGVPGPGDVAEFGLIASSIPFGVECDADVPFGALLVEDQRPILFLNGHELDVAGPITVGGFAFFEPELTLDSGLIQTDRVEIGNHPGSGALTVDRSVLAVDVGEGDVLLATDPLAEAWLTVRGPDSPLGAPSTLYADDLVVGAAGEGHLLLTEFGYLECNGSITLGAEAGSSGSLTAATGTLFLADSLRVGQEGQAEAIFDGAVAVMNDLVIGGHDAMLLVKSGAFVTAESLSMPSGPLSFIGVSAGELALGELTVTSPGDTVLSLDHGVVSIERAMLVPAEAGPGSASIIVHGQNARLLGAGDITLGVGGQSILRISDRGGVIANGTVTLGTDSFVEMTIGEIPSLFIGCGSFVAGGELAIELEDGMPPPPPGTSLTLVAAEAVSGVFSSVSLAPGMVGSVIYHATDIVFVAAAQQLGDLTGDGVVGPADLSVLLGDWGLAGSVADLNGDGIVSAADLAILLAEWG